MRRSRICAAGRCAARPHKGIGRSEPVEGIAQQAEGLSPRIKLRMHRAVIADAVMLRIARAVQGPRDRGPGSARHMNEISRTENNLHLLKIAYEKCTVNITAIKKDQSPIYQNDH